MKANIHEFDGLFRVLLFILSVIWAVMTSQWIWLVPGGILFATAIISWCPVYAMIGINAKKEAKHTYEISSSDWQSEYQSIAGPEQF